MTRIAILGYGNLGRGVEQALAQNPDMTLAGVYTRRDPASLRIATPGVPVRGADELPGHLDTFDVLILCGGSATDLPEQGPKYAALCSTVDSFDTHANIPAYFESVDAAARAGGHVSLISVGWDPGLFSVARAYASAVLPDGSDYTFWGPGVSQGHSDAIRRIDGVADAKQYTIPVGSAVEAVRAGKRPALTARDKHRRVCYVVLKEGADAARVEREIVTMPNYFADYDTEVHFLDGETFRREHSAMPHGGFVLRSGETGDGSRHLVEFALTLGSNPSFTSSVLVAYARAAHRFAREGAAGAKTVLDVPPAYLSPMDGAALRAKLV